MDIAQIAVTIHEKRNHPFEYGHYDASVTLSAVLEPGDIYDDVIQRLRDMARSHVLGECNNWKAGILEERRVYALVSDIESYIRRLRHNPFAYAMRCQELIGELPEDMQAEWRQKLDQELERLEAEEAEKEDEPFQDDETPSLPDDLDDESAF